jgi:hypothetical protein
MRRHSPTILCHKSTLGEGLLCILMSYWVCQGSNVCNSLVLRLRCFLVCVVWCFQFSRLSKCSPRYFTVSAGGMVLLLKCSCGMFPFRSVNVTCIDLFSLIFSLHLLVQFAMLSRWVCRLVVAVFRLHDVPGRLYHQHRYSWQLNLSEGCPPWIRCRGAVPARFLVALPITFGLVGRLRCCMLLSDSSAVNKILGCCRILEVEFDEFLVRVPGATLYRTPG